MCMPMPVNVPCVVIPYVLHVWHTINYMRCICCTLQENMSTQTHDKIYCIVVLCYCSCSCIYKWSYNWVVPYKIQLNINFIHACGYTHTHTHFTCAKVKNVECFFICTWICCTLVWFKQPLHTRHAPNEQTHHKHMFGNCYNSMHRMSISHKCIFYH